MKELVEYIAKSLVVDTDAVKVNMTEEDSLACIELSVSKNDIGRVIGKQGKIINSIRTILNSNNDRKQYKLVIKED